MGYDKTDTKLLTLLEQSYTEYFYGKTIKSEFSEIEKEELVVWTPN